MHLPIFKAKKINTLDSIEGFYNYTSDGRHVIQTLSFNKDIIESISISCIEEIDFESLMVSFNNGKSFLKWSDLEIHTCTNFKIKYTDQKNRIKQETQPVKSDTIFTILTDKGEKQFSLDGGKFNKKKENL